MNSFCDSVYGNIPLCDEMHFQSQSFQTNNNVQKGDTQYSEFEKWINMSPQMRKIYFNFYKAKLEIEIIQSSIININGSTALIEEDTKGLFFEETHKDEGKDNKEEISEIKSLEEVMVNVESGPQISFNLDVSLIHLDENLQENMDCESKKVDLLLDTVQPEVQDSLSLEDTHNVANQKQIAEDISEEIQRDIISIVETKEDPQLSLTSKDSEKEVVLEVPNEEEPKVQNNDNSENLLEKSFLPKIKRRSLANQIYSQKDSISQPFNPKESISLEESLPSKIDRPISTDMDRLSHQENMEIDSQRKSISDPDKESKPNNDEKTKTVEEFEANTFFVKFDEAHFETSTVVNISQIEDKELLSSAFGELDPKSENEFSFDFDGCENQFRKSSSTHNLGYTNEKEFKTPKPLPRSKLLFDKPKATQCPPIPPRPFISSTIYDSSDRQQPIPAPRSKRVGSLNDIRFNVDLKDTSDNLSSSDGVSQGKSELEKKDKLKKCKKLFGKLKNKIKVNLLPEPSEKLPTRFYMN